MLLVSVKVLSHPGEVGLLSSSQVTLEKFLERLSPFEEAFWMEPLQVAH